MDKTKVLVTTLIALVVVMAAILAYVFLIQPSLTGYAVERQQEGIDFAVITVSRQAATCQPIPFPLVDENGEVVVGEDGNQQTINLVAMECFPDRFPELEQQQQAQGSIEGEQIEEDQVTEE
ncbi:MAG: hypothetical protein WDZ69_01960 [Candidatus Pacearchaeota archaeon]